MCVCVCVCVYVGVYIYIQYIDNMLKNLRLVRWSSLRLET